MKRKENESNLKSEGKKSDKDKKVFKNLVLKRMKYKKFYLKNGKFDLEEYEKSGDSNIFVELLLGIMLVAFFGYSIWSFINSWDAFYGWYLDHQATALGIWEIIGGHVWVVVVLFIAIYIVTLWISYLVVKFFGKLSAWFIYGSAILQIILYGVLFYYVQDWEYSWIFLIPLGLQVLLLTVWHKKMKLAIEYVKISSLTVWKEKKLLIPQFIQTFWIIILSLGQIIVTFATFLDFNEIDPVTFMIRERTVTFTTGSIFAIYSLMYVFLCYIFIYTALGTKMLMVHHWYRGGELSFKAAFKMFRRRKRAIFAYAFFSSFIHIIQFFYKLFKGEIKVGNILDAIKVTSELKPVNPMSLDAQQGKKKAKTRVKLDKGKPKLKRKRERIPLRERIWMGLNFFTLPAIAIEDKNFAPALRRSMKMLRSNIVDLYIKHSNVNKLFRLMQYVSVILSGLIGALVGGLIGKFGFGYLDFPLYVMVAGGIGIFLWLGGMTAVLVINDLNMTYVTVMFIHTLDEKNKVKGYTRYELEDKAKVERKLLRRRKNKKKIETEELNEEEDLKEKYKAEPLL